MNPPAAHASRHAHACFGVTALVCAVLFGWMVTLGTFDFIAEDSFGSFYDHQAAAWLKGRWDVPEPALSGEAFVVDGKVYGYFGPTPALLRLPFVLTGIGFAQLTRLFMLLGYIACLAGAYALLRLAVEMREPGRSPGARTVVLFILTAGLGSTLFFLGSRAYVYHEAILCGAAFALWSVYFSLRFLQTAASRAWIAALVCGVSAVHARPPIGLFALSLLGCVALAHLLRGPQGRARPIGIGVLSALGILSYNAISYVKFGTFEGCPLRFNVQYDAEKLAVLGDRNFHPSNLRFNFDAYFRRPIFSVRKEFPYIYRDFIDRREYPESRMAYRDPTMAIPWSMPGLFALALAGGGLGVLTVRSFRRPLVVLLSAAIPPTLAMLTAVAVTQRYTADFLPFLIGTAAFGSAALEVLAGKLRGLAIATAAALGLLGIGVTAALTIHHQREVVWGVPEAAREEYVGWQKNVDRFFGVAP